MILEGTTKAVQQRISQCGLLLYFKPASNRMSITAKSIDPADASAWAIVLRHLKIGEFVAAGNFLLAGNRVGYPIKATANVKKIADIDEKYDFFGKSAGESEDKSAPASEESNPPLKIGNGYKTSGGYYMP